MFNPDEWLIHRFQVVADWAHSQNEAISPYQIAAQLAGFVAVTAMLKFMLMLSTNLSRPIEMFDAIIMLSWSAINFTTAKMQHSSWRRTGLTIHTAYASDHIVIRFFWFSCLMIRFAWIYSEGIRSYNMVGLLQDLVIISVCYFMACRPPAPRFRSKQWQPIPVSS